MKHCANTQLLQRDSVSIVTATCLSFGKPLYLYAFKKKIIKNQSVGHSHTSGKYSLCWGEVTGYYKQLLYTFKRDFMIFSNLLN